MTLIDDMYATLEITPDEILIVQGCKINITELANGIMKMVRDMPSEYQSAMGLGMLPAPLIDMLETHLEEKYDTDHNVDLAWLEILDDTPELLKTESEKFKKAKKGFVSIIMRRISARMLKMAD